MRKYLDEAHGVTSRATAHYLELVKKFKAEESEIRRDPRWTADGQEYYLKGIKKDYEEDVVRMSKELKGEYLSWIDKAKKEAEKVLSSPVKQADEQKLAKYSQSVNELKAKVMLALRPESSAKLVTDFVSEIDDPYIAAQFRQEFSTVIGSVIPGAKPEVKQQLAAAFDKLESDYITDEVKEARDVLEMAESMEKGTIFNYSVLDNAKDTFGAQFVPFINNPDAYGVEETEENNEQTNEGENL